MAVFNPKNREIECKLVYYGPGRGGKTTNLEWIHRTFTRNVVGEMVSINTDGDRTLFFDFLPLGLGKIRGCEIRVQLYTVPGQVKYSSTRKLVLKGVDGVVFVADSMVVRREKNALSLKDLAANLKTYGLNIFEVPLVMQFNKRDLEAQGVPLLSVEQLQRDLNRQLKVPTFPSSALNGDGVRETLKAALELTLKHLHRQMRWAQPL
jgi:mutual gliding-motility protein MglA